MSIQTKLILEALVSHAAASGYFDRVNTHEPKNPPGKGLTAAAWLQNASPIKGSGLNSTSSRVVFTVRIFTSMLTEPQDMIDPNIMDAADKLMSAYSGDFTLDGLIRNIDLLGASGNPLSMVAGYLDVANKLYRIMDITVPCIINDSWDQNP